MANKFINELNGIESVAVGDELPIWDSSESDTRKTTISKLSSALTVNLVGEGISAPPSSNAVANAIKNTNAVLHVETLPTSPDIKNVIYHNAADGKYYVGNKTAQTVAEFDTTTIKNVVKLPSSGIKDIFYCLNVRGQAHTLTGNDSKLYMDGTAMTISRTVDGVKYYDDLANYVYNTNFIRYGYVNTNNDTYGYVYTDGTDKTFTGQRMMVQIDGQKLYYGNARTQVLLKVGGSDIFVGTQAQWDALTTAQKNEYSQANITDTSSTVFVPVDTVADGNMNPVTSNAVYDKFNAVETTITGTSRTVSVTANTTDWFDVTAPTIPSDKRVVRYFATVNESQARVLVGYNTSSTPTGVIVSSSVSSSVTVALAAVVVDK